MKNPTNRRKQHQINKLKTELKLTRQAIKAVEKVDKAYGESETVEIALHALQAHDDEIADEISILESEIAYDNQ